MIEARGIMKAHGALQILDGISLSVRSGETAVLLGPSGGGKSTLLRCLNGLETFDAGEISVAGHTLLPGRRPEAELTALRRRLGMVFQQFNLFPHMSALENVASGPRFALGQLRDQAEAEARVLLERVGLGTRLDARTAQLSGGQQQRVAIARALAMKPEAILFDEPTSSLDPRMAAEVTSVMTDLARAGQTMVVVTHAMGFARSVAHTVHVLHAGRIAESGPPGQVFESPRTEVTRAFLQDASGG